MIDHSICILCGGKSKRFGTNKIFHKLGERTILEVVFKKLTYKTDDLFLQGTIANDSIEQLLKPNIKVFQDEVVGRGPLGGIYSALTNSKYQRVLIIAGDLPFFDVNIISEFELYCEYDLVIPRWRNGFLEPLCARYSKTVIPIIKEQLDLGDFKINNLFKVMKNYEENLKMKYLDIDNLIINGVIKPDCFKNINSTADLLM